MEFNKQLLLHPFAFGLFPGVAILAQNITEINFMDGTRTLIVSFLLSGILLIIFKLLIKDWIKAGIVCTLTQILFFSYGHIYELFRDTTIFGLHFFRHRFLGIVWISLFLIGVWWVIRRLQNPNSLTSSLNIVALSALIIPTFNLISFQIKLSRSTSDLPAIETFQPQRESEQALPDIYYIILDAYSRDDYLKQVFKYDNSPFLNVLEEKGFYIAHCSHSNYSQTRLSLATSLNMNYLETFYDQKYENNEKSVDRFKAGLVPYIKSSQVREILEDLGYRTIAFQTGYRWTELEDAALFLTPDNQGARLKIFGGVNSFEVLMIRSTGLIFLSAVSPMISDIILPDLDYPNRIHRDRILFVLDSLEKLPSIQGPKFIFAHIVSPHKPFVFGSNGEIYDREPIYRVGYPSQISYLNKRLENIVDLILTNSETSPIIILQADHGALQHVGESGRMGILNAYYLPEGGSQLLYENISPVNTFRVVFNYYFEQNYKLLEDISYMSLYTDPTNYQVIPNTRMGCE